MKLSIHPQASENYNSKIHELITKLISEHPLIERMKQPTPSNSDIHTSFHFNQSDIIGELKLSWTDKTGKVTARAFYDEEKTIGLFDEEYKNLIRVAEGLQKSINPKDVVSIEFLEESIFEWIKLKIRNETTLNMSEFVMNETEKQIKEYDVWIPISLFYIQMPFILGKTTFRAITKSMIDEWETRILSTSKEQEEIDSKKIYFERIRKEIQGLATATIKVEAERRRAYEIAFGETEKAMSVLRFFSPPIISPTQVCYCAPLGSQHQDTYHYLLVKDRKITHHISGLKIQGRPYWNFGREEFEMYRSPGLEVFHFLLNKEKLTDFQEKFLEAITIYSRSLLNKQLSDRLLYTLTALETIFLKDSGENIQDAISFRMAYMQDVAVEERRAIISNIKKTYGIRSSFVHHGQSVSIDNLEILEKFMTNAWISLFALFDYALTDITKEQFFEQLENRRLAG